MSSDDAMTILVVAKTHAKAVDLGRLIATGQGTRVLNLVYSDKPAKLRGWKIDAVMLDNDAMWRMSPELQEAIRMSQVKP